MSGFVLHLQSATQYERVEQVASFVGEDGSGSFGILAGHARMMTMLGFGLARFRVVGEDWQFLAVPGALVYFVDGQLYLSTRHYLRDPDFERISTVLRQQMAKEEEALGDMKQSVHRLEEEMMRHMWRMRRGKEASS
jgi:F-type H+-transporting ATPase subunit epsilon